MLAPFGAGVSAHRLNGLPALLRQASPSFYTLPLKTKKR